MFKIYAECDNCNKKSATTETTIEKLMFALGKNKWKYNEEQSKVFCPECAGKQKGA